MATMRHWIVGKCAAADEAARSAVAEAMAAIDAMLRVQQTAGGEAIRAVSAKAKQASETVAKGGEIDTDGWDAIRQMASAQVPEFGGQAKNEARALTEYDGKRKYAVWSMIQQMKAAVAKDRPGRGWMEQREEHRGWMGLCVRAWREEVSGWFRNL